MTFQTHQKSATFYNDCCIATAQVAVSPRNCPTKKEAKKILKAAEARKKIGTKSGIRDWIFVYLSMHTGLRVTEFAKLREGHIVCSASYYHYIHVHTSKTRHGIRVIPIENQTLEAINQYRDWKKKWQQPLSADEFFLRSPRKNEDGYRFRRESLYRAFKRVLGHAHDLEQPQRFTTHSMRHSFATRLYENQKVKDIKTISELLGHASEQITSQVYIHVFADKKIEAVQGLYT